MKKTNRFFRLFACLLACLLLCGALAPCIVVAEESGTEQALFFSESFESEFETRPSGWKGNVRSLRTTEYASDGSASIRFQDASTSSSYYVSTPALNLERGVYYRISVDVYNISGNGSVFVQFYNAAGTQTDSVSSTVTVTGKWTTVNFTVTLPDSAVSAVILLYSGMANKGETCYDNIRVYPEAEDATQEVYDFPLLTSSYPRLYFTSDELADLKAFSAQTEKSLAGYSGKESTDALLARADELLAQRSFSMTYYSSTTVTFSIPFAEKHFTSSPTGYSGSNYPYWQEMGNQMMEMMQTLALSYALTGKEAYADRAIELAASLANWSTWTEYPTVNRTSLETGYFVTGVCTVYDLCFDRLTADEKALLKNAIEERGLQPLYADLSSFTDHNYYVNKASALAMGALLLLGEDEDAARYLSRAYDFFAWYLACRYESDSQEGLSYTSYSLDLLFGALDQLKRVTGNDRLLNHPYTNVLFRWAIMSGENANGYGPPISDVYSNTYFFTVANVMNGTDCEGIAGWYLSTRNFAGITDFRKLVYYPHKDRAPAESPEQYFARTGMNLTNGVIDGIGWGALRTGWGKDDMLLVCVANNSTQGHSHYDQNSFVLALGGEWLFSDPGYQDYGTSAGSDFTLSYGHSTIYVDGASQSIKGNASLTVQMDSSAYSMLVGSAANAYQSPALSKFDRSYVMVNYGGVSYYVLADDIRAADAHDYTWVLNAQGMQSARYRSDGGYDVFSSNGGKFTGNEFFAVGKNRAVRVAFDREHSIAYNNWKGQGGLISVDAGDAAASASFCAVISALDGRGVNSMTVEKTVSVLQSYTNETQIGVRTGHGGLSDLIVISKSSGVSADGLVANGGSASLFGLTDAGSYAGYAMTSGTELTWSGKTLIRSAAPVSATVFFDGSESVILGTAGTEVRIYAPAGIGDIAPDPDGYCTLTLTSDRTVIRVNQATPGIPGGELGTTPVSEPAKKGCKSVISTLPTILTLCALCFIVVRRKR